MSAPRNPPIAPPPVVQEDERTPVPVGEAIIPPPRQATPARPAPLPPAPPPQAVAPPPQQKLQAPPTPAPKEAPPKDEMKPSLSSGGIVEHFAKPVEEPVVTRPLSRPVFDEDSEISEAPQLRPKRTMLWVVIAMLVAAAAAFIYANRP